MVLIGGLAVADRRAAARLQLVRVLPGARRAVAAGGRVGRRSPAPSRPSRCRARCSAGAGGSWPAGWCAPSARWRCGGCTCAGSSRASRLGSLAWRGAAPVLIATAPVLAVRGALWGGERTAAQAIAELVLWLAVLALATRRLERGLLSELCGLPARPGGRALVSAAPLRGRALCVLAAALISGFTLRRYLEPFDEGLLLQAATRMSDGQWPYADFGWAYGPGQPLAVAAAFKLFGPSVIAWRVLRRHRRRHHRRCSSGPSSAARPARGWALAGWLAAAVTIAQPTSANPVPIALALALGAVTVAVAGDAVAPPRRHRGSPGRPGRLLAPRLRRRRRPRGRRRAARAPQGGSDPPYVAWPVWPQCADFQLPREPQGGSDPPWFGCLGNWCGGGRWGGAVCAVRRGGGARALWDSLVGAGVRDGAAWRLPFPLEYEGHASRVAAAGAGRGRQGRARVLPAADRGGGAGASRRWRCGAG